MVSFDIWHHRLGHAGADSIQEIVTKELVKGMNIQGELQIPKKCENWIYSKHSTHPFNIEGVKEKETLEQVYINIWRLI